MKTKHLMIPALVAALMASAPGFAQDRYQGDRDNRWNQSDRVDRGDRGDRNDQGNRNYQGDRSYQGDRNQGDRNYQGDRAYQGDRNYQGDRRDGYNQRGGGRYGDQGYGGDRHWDGAGPDHNWHRGDRLPSRYRSNQYVVNDWRDHHLRPPPRGYHWVQSGGDYVLAAVATGVIADLIINSR